MKPHHFILACLLFGCAMQSARADIYAYTDADGSVTLSNVPVDSRYVPLVEGDADVPPPAAPAPGAMPAVGGKAGYEQMVAEVSRTYGVESALLHAVISVESNYNPRAVSRKGAAGLMQLMPKTAKRYGVADRLDPLQNVRGGAQYLRDLLAMFNNNVSLAIAAYNAGEQAVVKHGNRIPPYRETRKYVPKVLDFYRRYR